MTDNRATELLHKMRKQLDGCRRTETAGFDTYWITADALDNSLDELEQAIADELNARAERTCECVAEYAKSPFDGKTIVLVRCRDCSRTDNCCFIYEYGYEPNGFCSWGERKEA